MKANELRIGNKVQACLTREVVEIDWLALKHLEDGNIQVAGYDNSCVYKPIPLTEEWLLKFGFKKHNSLIIDSYSINISKYENLKELCVTIQFGNEYISIREGESKHPTSVDIVTTLINGDVHGRPFYVHQLQNLYFALTGEELKEL